MKIPRLARNILSLIALLALAWVHVFKPVRGFECDLSGAATYTLQDHCHGVNAPPCHHDEERPADDDTHHHTALVESWLALKADATQFASAAAAEPVLLPVINVPPVVWLDHLTSRFNASHQDGRQWPRILSRSIALRV